MIFCPEASDSKVGSPSQSPGSLDTLLQSIYVSQLRRNVYKGDGHPFNLLMGIPMMRDRGQLRPYPGVSCDPTRARGQLRPYPCQGSAATLPTHTFRFAWGGTWGLGLGDLGFRGGTSQQPFRFWGLVQGDSGTRSQRTARNHSTPLKQQARAFCNLTQRLCPINNVQQRYGTQQTIQPNTASKPSNPPPRRPVKELLETPQTPTKT